MANVLAQKIPRTEKPGRLQSMGLQRVGHDLAPLRVYTHTHTHTHTHTAEVHTRRESVWASSLVRRNAVRQLSHLLI